MEAAPPVHSNLRGASDPVFYVTEKWIRERLNLEKNPLENFQSLALPGGYSEKITHLGRSLLSFTHLRHIDLSRNALESLQGLEHLQQLESLNIYYNKISSLKNLFLLHHNRKLIELDLRLNPVTYNEPDYRLFLIHMLLHLRTLDERAVVDSERRAAIMHFTTDQACLADTQPEGKSSANDEMSFIPQHKRPGPCRAELVRTLVPHPALQENTDELLELAHTSTPKKALLHSDIKANLVRNKSTAGESHGVIGYNDEDEAYSDVRMNFNFTPAPQSHVKCDSHPNERAKLQKEDLQPNFDNFMTQLITLLQRYIPTDISLLSQDLTLRDEIQKLWKQDVKTYGEDQIRLQKEFDDPRRELDLKQSALEIMDIELNRLGEKKSKLEAKCSDLEQTSQDFHFKNEFTQLLKQANKNILSLLQHMRQLQEENAQIKSALDESVQQLKLVDRIGELEHSKASLEAELSGTQQKTQTEAHANTKLQELTDMVQESHRSLVTTNDRLLKELETVKLKHSQEVSQMLKNYQHLKNTHFHLLDTSHK